MKTVDEVNRELPYIVRTTGKQVPIPMSNFLKKYSKHFELRPQLTRFNAVVVGDDIIFKTQKDYVMFSIKWAQ